MKSRVLWVPCLALIVVSASCSGKSESEQGEVADTPQPTAAVAPGAGGVPVVSARSYVGGSAKVTVTGSFQINNDIATNTQASFSDGEMTWLQYGESGSEAPNALVTVSPEEVGVTVGRGKAGATAGGDACAGGMDVTGNSITGHYKCPNVTSYDSGSGQMGNVNIEVHLTAKS